MKHFVTEEWVDFLNSQLSPQQMEPMQAHLKTGCKRCSQLFETWSLVSQAAKREPDFEVPESAVRHVLNAFAIMAESKSTDRAFEIPRLVFDSLADQTPSLKELRATFATRFQMSLHWLHLLR